MTVLTPTTQRIDRRGEFVEEAALRESDGSTLFEMSYLPIERTTMGVVICSSILMELLGNYRREVLLARALAARGIAVHRFHYRGSGHSGGENADLTWETMLEDARESTGRFMERTGIKTLAFVGTRWGACVASVVGQRPDSPVVLWEPVVDGSRYFREMIRARLVRELQDRRFAGASTDSWKEEMRQRGWVDLLGYTVHRKLYESGQKIRLDVLLVGRRSPVLLVQLGQQRAMRPDIQHLRDTLRQRGVPVDVRMIRDEFPWFFPGDVMKSPDGLLRMTTRWLLTSQSGSKSSA